MSISFIPPFDFFQIGCFLHWIQSVYPHLFCSRYDNGFPLYFWSPSGLLCWLIFILSEVVLDLVYLSIFSGLAPLMSADMAQTLSSLVCSCLNSYWAFHLFPLLISFELVAFCPEFNLFTSICFVLFMIIDFPYICDWQVGYSAGGHSLSLRWILTWYIYPFLQDWMHWWVLILHKTYDHWSVAGLTVIEHFIYSHFWLFWNWLFSALNSICLPPFVLFSLW